MCIPMTTLSTPVAIDARATAEQVGSPVSIRFRERVRNRIGRSELLAFHLGGERFAFDVRALDEVLDAPLVELLPQGDPTMVGLTTHHSRPIPVFDTSRVLGMPATCGRSVLVMRSGHRRVGLLVDEVDDVISIDLSRLQPPPFGTDDDLLLGVSWTHGVLSAILDARALIAACQPRGAAAP